jgi:serine/threonine protein kinase
MANEPTELSGFEILHRLGAGGMAEVFLAKKRGAEGTYKLLVVKRILPQHATSRRFRQMFVEEAHLATRLNHPNIVQVYEFSDHGDEGLLLSMEHVEGCDLGRLMSAARTKGAKIPPYVSAFIIGEAAKGLHYAHERKDESEAPLSIIHRDVSPQNILVSFDGVVKIADFGIASANLFREEPGVLKGKFGYMSPEQARGEKIDRRSDIYALGIVFYELLALRSPYGKLDDDSLLAAVRSPMIPSPRTFAPEVPADLEAIVLRALSKSRDDRFQTARDLASAIARAFIARQELVDHTSVEKTLQQLLGGDGRVPSVKPARSDEPQTLAAVPFPRGGGEGAGSSAPPRKIVNEVRHVAVATLRVDGLAELGLATGSLPAAGMMAGMRPGAAKRSLDSIRATLDSIAYKHGAVWSWDGDNAARAVVGLLSNPARAAAEAASLAIDVHEALAGASQDLPVVLRAAIGIVRGIAAGERDDQGHLQDHALQPPAGYLSDELGWRTPFGKTYVAGGVYRVVRRDFRWAEAPSLDLRGAELAVPAQMRVYALVRPLSRDERAHELSLLPNDLVGRDAEKADLHAALHASLSSGEAHSKGRAPARSPVPSSAPSPRNRVSSDPPAGSFRKQVSSDPPAVAFRNRMSSAPPALPPETGVSGPPSPLAEATPRPAAGFANAPSAFGGSATLAEATPRPAAGFTDLSPAFGESSPPPAATPRPLAAFADAPPNSGRSAPLAAAMSRPAAVFADAPPNSGRSASLNDARFARPSPLNDAAPPPASRLNLSVLDDVDDIEDELLPPPSRAPTFEETATSGAPLGVARGHLVARVVTGEMGIGKTALVATFLSELPQTFRILQVESSPVKSELPFATTADILRAATSIGPDD